MNQKILFFLMFFLCSCHFRENAVPYVFIDKFTEQTTEKSLGFESIQANEKAQCEQNGPACSEYERCKAFCDDLFFYNKGRENCYKWSYSFFPDFIKLFEQIETLSFSNLDFSTVDCFFEMSEDHKMSLFKNFPEKSAEKLLAYIASHYELALPLFHSDKVDFDIFVGLFGKFDRRIQRGIREKISDQTHFLILAHRSKNKAAWAWLDGFIHYDCKKSPTCRNPLEYYCEILEETPRSDLESFFENPWFERAYKRDIESSVCDSYDCEYGKISDFKEFCEKM